MWSSIGVKAQKIVNDCHRRTYFARLWGRGHDGGEAHTQGQCVFPGREVKENEENSVYLAPEEVVEH